MSSLDNLTEKERLFVEHYLTDCNMNGGKSAVKAGYSSHSRYEIAYELLRKPQIANYIKEYLEQHSLGKQELLKRLSDVAKNVGSEYVLLDGSIDLEPLLSDGYGHLIKEVRRYKNGKVRVLFHDSAKALDSLARIYKLIDDGMSVMINFDEKIQQERELTEKLNSIHDKLLSDPIEKQVNEYRQQLKREQTNERNTN